MEFNITNIQKRLDFINNPHRLKCLMNEAYEVFNSGEAGVDKRIIIKLFRKTDGECEADIKLRLATINTLYSTDINKTKEGLKNLARKIHDASIREFDGESDLGRRFINFFKTHGKNNGNENKKKCKICKRQCKSECSCKCNCNGDMAICQIIYGKHGYNKIAKRRAISLATKYAYFLTGQRFSVYDSFVHKICQILSQDEPISLTDLSEEIKKDRSLTMPINFFGDMYTISSEIEKSGIDNGVDKFDAFCWTWGKIAESEDGEVSVFDKDKSKTFCQKLIDAELLTK